MSYFDKDEREMLEVYMLETRQLLEQLEGHLLETEKKHAFSKEEIHAVFRIMHTIKGSSAMMRLTDLSRTAHKLEDLFAYYRENCGVITSPDPELFDLLFAASDYIEKELEGMGLETYVPRPAADIERRAQEVLARAVKTGEPKREKAPEQKAGQDAALTQQEDNQPAALPEDFAGKGGVIVKIMLEPGCRMEHIRAFMLIRQIGGLCTCVESFPKDLDKSQGEDAYIGEHGVLIRFESQDKNAVLETLKKGLFVKSCEVVEDRTLKLESPKEQPADAAAEDTRDTEFLNVRMNRLDLLQNLAEEMLIQMLALDNALEQAGEDTIREGTAYQLNRLISDVERTVMEMRMVPISSLVPKLRRVFRDINRVQKKEIDFIINCGDVEADKSVVEYVFEALMHMLRNAVDHGLETPEERIAAGKNRKGKIIFTAESTVGELILSIQDDGRGIDTEKVKTAAIEKGFLRQGEEEYTTADLQNLLLHPGFTTNDKVTQFSGRGVGLDVVKNIMEEAGGHLYIESEMGKGSKFIIVIPLTLATMECVRFQAGGCSFSLPARYVMRFLGFQEQKSRVQLRNGRSYIMVEDRLVPLVDLHRFYHLGGETADTGVIIYLKNKDRELCIAADQMFAQKRIVVKPLPALFGPNYRRSTGISGNSLMGNGTVCSALDMETIAELYESKGAY